MIIVHIEDVFIPDAGYQINIMPKYLATFGHEVYIVTSKTEGLDTPALRFFGGEDMSQRDKQYTKETGVQIIRVAPLIKKLISGRMIPSGEIFKATKSLNPDILYVHGNDTFTAMLFLKKRHQFNCPMVMDSHMLEMASVNKLSKLFRWYYRKRYSPIIKKHNITVIRTQDDPYVESCLGIPLTQAPWISVGSDTLLFHPAIKARDDFRKTHGIKEDAFVVVYTGKLDETKGGMLLAEAFATPFDTTKEVVLVAVGNTSGSYGEGVEAVFQQSPHQILRFPTQKYADLAQFYQCADLSVFPKQCSLSFYDAQACGLPVVSEDNNINVARNAHGNGLTFRSGDVADFRNKIADCANMDCTTYNKIRENALEFIVKEYNYATIAEKYQSILDAEILK